MHEDQLLSSYNFALPSELIAQEPPKNRGDSRLMVHDRKKGRATATLFSELLRYLPAGVIVANNSRVVPARLIGKRENGGTGEILLTTPLPHIAGQTMQKNEEKTQQNNLYEARINCLVKSSKKIREGERIIFDENLSVQIMKKEGFECTGKLSWTGNLSERLQLTGLIPLPPYIKRPITTDDALRYQTVYAAPDKNGSIAAPTAGLHFTQDMKEKMIAAGFQWVEVTLYVGYGTFNPVRCVNIADHIMHEEYVEITEESAQIIARAKEKKIPVISLGTTSARTLEGVYTKRNAIEAFSGSTDIFLYPGKELRVVDHLLTNFHLPKSTLLMLISAFAGRQAILETYQKAIKERFRFFSYGDAMLIL
ncbi:S-adenosylmethionine:tRNA ribosyltransferase-isomerase [Deltaproteobacteria bacterium]|nr:S-adenosylmethionine:tRNA ribosyltransferase-isomerase [Deltaproteobacteria bacterium]